MNKKAFFLPLFIIVTLVTLSSMVFVIETTKLGRQDIVGLQAVSIIKAYDEAEKIQIYLEKSVEYSSENAIDELYLNGGYPYNNKCRKIPSIESEPRYIILDKSCTKFSPEENFNEILKSNIKEYRKQYKSKYKTFNELPVKGSKILESIGIIPEHVIPEQGEIIASISEKNTNNIELKYIEEKDNKLYLTFSEIELRIEFSPESYHKFIPKAVIKNPKLEIFDSLYKAVSENCIKKIKEECMIKLKNIFTNIEIEEQNNILKIKLPYESSNILFAIDLNQDLPTTL